MFLGAGGKEFDLFCPGTYSSLGVTADGKIWAWGMDYATGVLGQGDIGKYVQNTPIEITDLPTPSMIWTDGEHSCAVVDIGTTDQDYYWWGEMTLSQYNITKISLSDIIGA